MIQCINIIKYVPISQSQNPDVRKYVYVCMCVYVVYIHTRDIHTYICVYVCI